MARLRLAQPSAPAWVMIASIIASTGCSDPPPPVPLPWKTSANQTVEIVSAEYSVSRFWNCSWSSSCPSKYWAYCLRIVPKTPDAALAWYQVFNKSDLLLIRTLKGRGQLASSELRRELATTERRVAEGDFTSVELENIRLGLPNDRARLQHLLTLERQSNALAAEDPALKQQLFVEMREGLMFTASYYIASAGTRSEIHHAFDISGRCAGAGV